MGLTREDAYRILGLNEGASHYVVRAHYRKLANRYHPDKNLHKREIASQKFQKVVEAYVRLQIEPDDCDQLKMKMILTELYAINEDILAGEYSFSEDSDSDIENPTNKVLVSYCSDSSLSSQKGPYAEVLQDFMLRSYMSGGRKTKPSVNMGTEKKRHASEREFALATKHADELLMGEEQERKKEEKRKQRNKKKKEAKKKKKDQMIPDTNDDGDIKTSLSLDLNGDNSEKEDEEIDDEGIHSILTDIGNGLDMSSAFFSRVTSKLTDTPKQHNTVEQPDQHHRPLLVKNLSSSSSVSSTSTPKKNNSSSSIGYSSSGNMSDSIEKTNNWRSSSSSSSSSSVSNEDRENEKEKDTSDSSGKLNDKEAGKDKEILKKEKQKIKPTTTTSRTVKGITHKIYQPGKKSQYVPNNNNHNNNGGRHSGPTNLPPRLIKLQQQKSLTKKERKLPSSSSPVVVKKTVDKKPMKTRQDSDEKLELSSQNDDDIRDSKDSGTTVVTIKKSDQYSPEAILKNGESHDLDQSRKMAVLGNRAAKEGRFQDAVRHFTKAIEHYSSDLRYFGNRSFCYEYMKEYELALQDANKALKIDLEWPKGHFRKGKALFGLKMYKDAEASFKRAIEFDSDYKDAKEELKKTQIKIITLMGYDEASVIETLSRFNDNVQDAIKYLNKTNDENDEGVVSASNECSQDTEKAFKTVTFKGTKKTKNAGFSQPVKESSTGKVKVRGPVNGNECYFWRTTGCFFGSKCKHRHVDGHKGIDTAKLIVKNK